MHESPESPFFFLLFYFTYFKKNFIISYVHDCCRIRLPGYGHVMDGVISGQCPTFPWAFLLQQEGSKVSQKLHLSSKDVLLV